MTQVAVPSRGSSVNGRRIALIVVIVLLSSSLLAALGPTVAEDRAAGDWTMDSSGLPTSGTYFGVAFGDVNNDGKLDVVGASDGDGLRVFIGDGAGHWSAVSSHPETDGGFGDVVLGDYDDDGDMDIFAGSPGNSDGSPKGLHVYRGDGKGGFSDVTASSGLPTSGNWRGVAVDDVDGDGHLDLAATNGYGTSEGIHVYLGDGDGGFEDQSTGLPNNQDRDSSVVLADFDNDDDLDLAAGGAAGVDVYLVTKGPLGNLAWAQSSVGLPDQRYSGVSGADWNKDGLTDLVISAYAAGGGVGVYAYKNTRNGATWSSSSSGLPDDGDYIENAVSDMDGDGNPDIVTAGSYGGEYGIHVYYGDGTGAWQESSPGFSDNVQYVGVDVGDYNGDGTLDIVAGKRSRGGGIEVWKNPSAVAPPPQPEVEITYPGGGESLTGGTDHGLTWTISSGTAPYTVTLAFSTDSGATFSQTIATDLAQDLAGDWTHQWSVPVVNSATVRVRAEVVDAEDMTVTRAGRDFEIDTEGPSVSSTFPRNGAVDVSVAAPVIITFDEGMDASTSGAVSISGPGSPSLEDASWSGTQLTLATSGLQAGSGYAVTVSTVAVDDSSPGNAMVSGHEFSFITGSGETPTPPIVTGTDPLYDATDVAIGTTVEMTFSKAMDLTATQGAVSSSPSFEWTPSWSDGDTVLTMNPRSDLIPNTRYALTVTSGALASDGTALDSPYTFSFTTGDPPDVTVPTVMDNYPPDRQREILVTLDEITITFSEPMDRTATEAAVSIDQGTINGMTWRVEDTVLALAVDLEDGKRHTVTVGTGARDRSGNPLTEEHVFYFVTREPLEPQDDGGLGSPLAPLLLLSLLLVAVPMVMRNRRR